MLSYLAERTGLEPATPGVTGRYSNQLNYRSRLVENVSVLSEARIGRNPRTGEALSIKAARMPKFRAGKALKDSIN